MRIAISGKSGCGNTTTSTALAAMLGYPVINYTFRNMALDKGMTFEQLCKLAETDDSVDRELDAKQVEMALNEEHCILGSRLAIWMLKEADLKVYLTASVELRAKRIFTREGGDHQAQLKTTIERDKRDSARYKRIYGIDNEDTSVADVVIDTEGKTPEDVAREIALIAQSLK